MTRHTHHVFAAIAALAVALVLCACDVPAAGKPVLYADQLAAAEAGTNEAVVETAAEDEPTDTDAVDTADAPVDDFFPVESVGEGVVSLRLENHLGATITSVSMRANGTDGWPDETNYTGLSIPNGSQFELRVDAVPEDLIDFRYEGADGTTFLAIGSSPAGVAMDHRYDDIIMLRYGDGVAYFEYTNHLGLTVDTHLSAQEALESMRAQFEDRYETFTFTERDMEGVEAGQETENCLD